MRRFAFRSYFQKLYFPLLIFPSIKKISSIRKRKQLYANEHLILLSVCVWVCSRSSWLSMAKHCKWLHRKYILLRNYAKLINAYGMVRLWVKNVSRTSQEGILLTLLRWSQEGQDACEKVQRQIVGGFFLTPSQDVRMKMLRRNSVEISSQHHRSIFIRRFYTYETNIDGIRSK